MKGSDISAVWHCLAEHDELRKQLVAEGAVVWRGDTAGRPMIHRLEPSEEVDLDRYHECVLLLLSLANLGVSSCRKAHAGTKP